MHRRSSSHYRSSVQGENRVRWVIVVLSLAAVLILGLILGLYFGLRDENTKKISVDGQVDLDLEFNDEYKDPTSNSFQQLQQDFCTEMENLYQSEDLENCDIISVVQGSVRIRYLITFNIQMDQEESFLQDILSKLQAVPQGKKPNLFKNLPIVEESIVLSITTDMVTGQQCKTSSVCSGVDANEAIESVFSTTETCNDNSCSNGGTCIETTSSVLCLCHGTGFNGDACSDDIDECLDEPCLHNGNCTNSPSSFDCSCAVGFSGAICEADINECDSSPCNNGGTCSNNDGSFVCNCYTTGYTGDVCTEDINECDSSPCNNGAICSNNDGGFVCHCDGTGYTGDMCTKDINECDSSPCNNGGICSNNDGSFVCHCDGTGYTGDVCTEDINECQNVTCEHGTCEDLINAFDCICDDGYDGQLCDSDVNECDDDPCQNGAGCSNSPGSFVCVCIPLASGYTGNLCDEDFDECVALTPCTNGTCLNTVGSYKCICDDGYTGEDCDDNINECDNGPCLNGGTCADTPGSFTCNCTATGYTGDVCGSALCEYREIHSCDDVVHYKSDCREISTMTATTASDCFEAACNSQLVNTINYVHTTVKCHFLECQATLQLVETSDSTEIYIRQPDYVTQTLHD